MNQKKQTGKYVNSELLFTPATSFDQNTNVGRSMFHHGIDY
jgi:hypothetical protein